MRNVSPSHAIGKVTTLFLTKIWATLLRFAISTNSDSFTENFTTENLLHMCTPPHLDEGHPRALDGYDTHSLAELQVQDEDLSGIKQQHVVPLGWQVGQLQTVVQRHRLCTTVPQRRVRTGMHTQ